MDKYAHKAEMNHAALAEKKEKYPGGFTGKMCKTAEKYGIIMI
jgi:hypothetical protein